MQQPVYEISPRAARAIHELHLEFRKKIAHAEYALLVPPGYYSDLERQYTKQLNDLIRQGVQETQNDRTIRVQCPACKRIELIAGDVDRWKCVCGSIERLAFQTRLDPA